MLPDDAEPRNTQCFSCQRSHSLGNAGRLPGACHLLPQRQVEVPCQHQRHSPEVLGHAARVDVHVGEHRGVLPRLGEGKETVHAGEARLQPLKLLRVLPQPGRQAGIGYLHLPHEAGVCLEVCLVHDTRPRRGLPDARLLVLAQRRRDENEVT